MKNFLFIIFFIYGFIFPVSANKIEVYAPEEAIVKKIFVETNQYIYSGDVIASLKTESGDLIDIKAGKSGQIIQFLLKPYQSVKKGELLFTFSSSFVLMESSSRHSTTEISEFAVLLKSLYKTTGIAALIAGNELSWTEGFGRFLMFIIGLGLLYLGINRKFEPLLLVPIAFGCLLANIPIAGIAEKGGLLDYIFEIGISTGIFPLIIFMGVGALTDFGPMIANPKTALLGGAAQIGIFSTLIGALALNVIPGIDFSLQDAASIGIIGGADGPTAIFLSGKLSPRLLGSIAVAAYSYMALVPIIQPPIMKFLTTPKERKIRMKQMRVVSRQEKIIFPLLVLTLCMLFLPAASPLIGMLMFGNLLRECGVVERLSSTAQNTLINITTLFLGLGVGSKLSAEKFLSLETLGILLLGIIAFSIGTASGIIIAKIMNLFIKDPINPLIGAAGVSAVPMAARVANKIGLENDPQNFLIMHAMGPNVSGVIGSAVAAGVLLAVL